MSNMVQKHLGHGGRPHHDEQFCRRFLVLCNRSKPGTRQPGSDADDVHRCHHPLPEDRACDLCGLFSR